jgi:hypothetical protein
MKETCRDKIQWGKLKKRIVFHPLIRAGSSFLRSVASQRSVVKARPEQSCVSAAGRWDRASLAKVPAYALEKAHGRTRVSASTAIALIASTVWAAGNNLIYVDIGGSDVQLGGASPR